MSTDETAPVPPLATTVIETERLTLRAFTEAEIDSVDEAVRDPGLQRWLPLPRPGQPYTRADAEQWCLVTAPEARVTGDGQQWAAIERDTDRFVGSFGLTRTRWQALVTEVGYWVAPWARDAGFATEAATAVSRWAIDRGFQRVELKAASANLASRRVAEKAGFTFEGVERNAMPLHEGRVDLATYSLIPTDLG